jgi:hypothetical protein
MEEIFNKLIINSLTPNSYYVLHSVKTKVTPQHEIVNVKLEIKKLKDSEWLDENGGLTTKAVILIQEIDSYFKNSKKKTSKVVMGDNFMENMQYYLDIFPNFKLPSGKYAKSDIKNIENAFRWFFQQYNYDWDTILAATNRYVNEYELNGFKYMRTSQYFIKKQNLDKSTDSELANYCSMIKNGVDEDSPSHFQEKVV